MEQIYKYYTYICDTLLELSEPIILDFIYSISNIYNYRCKTYNTVNLSDNILFIFLRYISNKYNKFDKNKLINNCIENNIDLNNITYEEVQHYEKSLIYEILLLKLIHITIPYSIQEIEHNNAIIYDYSNIIDKINNNDLLQSFETIQKYIVSNNNKKINKYEEFNKILYNKLNKNLLVHIYNYYIELINKLSNNIKNNELFTNIITYIIDFYIFYTQKHTYIYINLEEKYNSIRFFVNIFNSISSNINLDIKYIEFFNSVLNKEGLSLINKINVDMSELLLKSFNFYTELDTYEDYYKNNIKYRIMYLYNNLYYTGLQFEKNIYKTLKYNTTNKFLISLTEDININITNFILYYNLYLTNKDYSSLANTYHIYLEEFLRFYKFLFRKYIHDIDKTIIEVSINKLNNNIVKLNKICTRKNNVYKIMLYIIDIYLIFTDTEYLQYIKNDTTFFNYDTFINIADNLYTIHKHANIKTFRNLINTINTLNIIVDDEYTDIPEDFLDPLYNTIIEIPVVLPSSGHCVDYNIIKKHLLYHNFDPFNRDKLTLEILDEYNNKKEIKKINNDFRCKIETWKNQQKL